MTGGLTGKVAQDAKGLPWRTAVAELAARIGAGVGEYGPILVLAPRVKTLPYETPLTLVTKDVDVRAFAKTVAARTGVAIVLAGDVHGRVRCDLNQASWRDALGEVARQLGCVVEGCGAVLVLRRAPVAAAPTLRTHFEFVDLGLAEAVATIAKITSANVVVERMADVKVSVQGDEVSCGAVLAAIAAAVDTNFMGEAPNLFRLGGGNIAPKTATDVTAEDVDLRTFAELVRTATQINVPVPSDAKERLTVFAIAAPLADLLRAAALATGRRVVDEFDAALGRAALHVK
ncbi:MAG TPA: hypothetical protein VK348_13930 [Planctomycetota bacterium]|nr:hypothetical protein [Planctomycetota bacterium]